MIKKQLHLYLVFYLLFIFINYAATFYDDINREYFENYINIYTINEFNLFNKEVSTNQVKLVDNKFICESNNISCSNNGICNEDKSNCICNNGYISIEENYYKCSYKQKLIVIALLLELIPGLGHLYLQNYLLFCFKFTIYFLYIFFLIVVLFIGAINDSNTSKKYYLLCCKILKYTLPLFVLYYIFDIVFISIGGYKDEYDIDLY